MQSSKQSIEKMVSLASQSPASRSSDCEPCLDSRPPSDSSVSQDHQNQASPALVSLRGVGLRFGTHSALQDIDLDIQAGSFTTLVGPNGAGKTTCARVIGGLAQPDTGTIRRRHGLRIGYAPQHLDIPDSLPLTASRFIAMRPDCHRDRIRKSLIEVDALPLIDRPMRALSGGECQRIVIARALMGEPELLILDEPTQGLDANGCDDLFRLILELQKQRGCTILMVSHDLHVVSAYSDHVICLNRHICCQGPPQSVNSHPDYRRFFPGRSHESHAIYVHHHDHRHDIGGQVSEHSGNRTRKPV